MTHLTAPAIDWGEDRAAPGSRFRPAPACAIGDIEVQSFSIPHDAIDPVGFAFEAQGVRIGVATDLGYIPESIKFHLRRTDLLLLEANHDLDMLKVGPYPWSVKQRVMSRVGHLSNHVMAEYLAEDLDSSTAHLVLGHLSEQNNHPGNRALCSPARRSESAACAGPHACAHRFAAAYALGSFQVSTDDSSMIPRYTRPEMGRIWSDQNRFQQWLEVELAASEALAELGVVPAEAAAPAAPARRLRGGAHPRNRRAR